MAQEIISKYLKITDKPEQFEDKSSDVTNSLQGVSKEIYDHLSCKNSLSHLKEKSLKKLFINGFDQEQIWQQVVLRNRCFETYLNNIPKPNSDWQKLIASKKTNENLADTHIDKGVQSSDDEYYEGKEEIAYDDDDDSSMIDPDEDIYSAEKVITDDEDSNMDNEDAESIVNDEKNKRTPGTSKKKLTKKYKSGVDDQFFKVSKLEQFLRLEDLKEERRINSEAGVNEEEEDDIDMFADIPSEDVDDSESDSEEGKKSSKEVMYEDFFDAPDSGDESVNESDNVSEEGGTDWQSLEANEDISDKEITIDNAEFKSDEQNTTKTAFELEQEKIQKKIAAFEESMLKPPAWQLTGEVAATSRPIDSLVHLQTDFDMNARPVILEDNELCIKMENMAKLAIRNKAFNDGIRKYKTMAEEITYKKDIAIEQTKSKKGLAEVYEEDFLKKQKKQEEEEDPKHVEIKKMMDNIFPELQALFCHIPKRAVPDVKIVSNLPAITVEEVAPTSVSDVALLAPEEVKKNSGHMKGQTERTDTDRKRERRKKKIHQKLKQKKQENKIDSDKPQSARARKQEKINTLKKLKQFRNTTIASNDGEKIKSSKDFFSKLQDAAALQKSNTELRAKKLKK